jgi:hypothetical protein
VFLASNVCRGFGHGALVVLLLNFLNASVSVAAESPSVPGASTYPRTLSADEMRAHFAQNAKISAKADGIGIVKSFTLKFRSDGWYNGNAVTGGASFAGKWTISSTEPKLCMTTTSNLNGAIDLTGCYVLQQTGERSFVLVGKDSWIAYGEPTGLARGGADRSTIAAASPEQVGEPILIDIVDRQITPESFKSAATKALAARGWNITSSTTDQIDASLIKDREYRVRIVYRQAAIIKIAFVQGYGARSQGWLQNLKKDMEQAFVAALNR